MKSILDPSFRYTASFATDLRKTFARIRREERNGVNQPIAPPLANVSFIAANATKRR